MRSPAIASDPAPVGMTRFGFDTMKLLTVKPKASIPHDEATIRKLRDGFEAARRRSQGRFDALPQLTLH
jgi:hypothetical protein